MDLLTTLGFGQGGWGGLLLLGALMTWGVAHIPIRLRGLLYTNYFLSLQQGTRELP